MTISKTNNINPRTLLSTLWIFVTLNYLYADLMGLMLPELLHQFWEGDINGMKINQGFLLAAAVLMEIPMSMVVLSRFLPYKANRLANLIAGSIKTFAVFASLFAGKPILHYVFFSAIEMTTTMYIIWYALKWKEPQEVVL